MYHYKARIYAPTLGRFLQVDPIGYEDQWNLYAYVANDPVNGTDPTGMEEDSIHLEWESDTVGEYIMSKAFEGGVILWNAAVAVYNGSNSDSRDQSTPTTATKTDDERSGPFVYRGLSKTDNPAKGLWAANPLSSATPAQHVNGKKDTPFISTTKSLEVATMK